MYCKDCMYWKRHGKEDSYLGMFLGVCSSDKFVDVSCIGTPSDTLVNDSLEYYDHEMYAADFRTGEKFGCIHFEER